MTVDPCPTETVFRFAGCSPRVVSRVISREKATSEGGNPYHGALFREGFFRVYLNSQRLKRVCGCESRCMYVMRLYLYIEIEIEIEIETDRFSLKTLRSHTRLNLEVNDE